MADARTSDRGSWLDVTVPIRDRMVAWPGDPGVRVVREQDLERGDRITVSRLELGAHTGTHVDAPLHFIRGGAAVEALDLEAFVGPARVVRVASAPAITRADVDALGVARGERLLIRTSNSDRCWSTPSFVPDYVYVGLEAACRLVELGVRTVGIDYLSIGGGGDAQSSAIHRTLLSAGVSIIEGLDLRSVEPAHYDLLCLPLRIAGGDGAPARVLLRRRA